MHVVFMGVSGTGKSTIALRVAERLDLPFAEADQFHPEANIAKMSEGVPLTDEDRRPWLALLAEWIGDHEERGDSTSCARGRPMYVSCTSTVRPPSSQTGSASVPTTSCRPACSTPSRPPWSGSAPTRAAPRSTSLPPLRRPPSVPPVSWPRHSAALTGADSIPLWRGQRGVMCPIRVEISTAALWTISPIDSSLSSSIR